VVYEDQVRGTAKPLRRVVAGERQVYRRATDPHDWQAAVLEAAELRRKTEAELLEELRRGVLEAEGPATFGELAEAYEKDAQDRGTRWDREKYRCAVVVEEVGRDTPAASLNADWLQTWRQDLRTRRKLTGRSVNAYVTLLRAICRLGVRTGKLTADPTAHLRPYPEHRGEVEYLTEAQLAAVLDAARVLQKKWEGAKRTQGEKRRAPIFDLVTVAYQTGARTGNVLSLRWGQHVDWEAAAVVWQPAEVKNRRRVVVPMTQALKDVLLDRWPGPNAVGWVFPSPDKPGLSLSNQSFRLAWRDVVALANKQLGAAEKIPADFKVYNLRHTRATHVLAATGNLRAVADLLGDTVAMVEQRYAGRSVPGLRQALEQTEASLCPKAVPKRPPKGSISGAADEGPEKPN
jgi:integrase